MAVSKAKNGESGETRVGSIAAAIAVLRHLALTDAPRGVNAIARELGLSQSSCFNILRTLVAERFVEFDPTTKQYVLGVGPIMLARRALDPANAFDLVRPLIDRMSREHGVTIDFWRLTRNAERLVLLGHSESEAVARVQLPIGHRIPRVAGAVGRIAVAMLGLGRDEIGAEFPSVRWDVPLDLETYLDEVAEARRRGWSLDRDQYWRGVQSLGLPVFDGNVLRYCLSLTVLSGRADAADSADEALKLAREIEHRLFGVSRPHLAASQ